MDKKSTRLFTEELLALLKKHDMHAGICAFYFNGQDENGKEYCPAMVLADGTVGELLTLVSEEVCGMAGGNPMTAIKYGDDWHRHFPMFVDARTAEQFPGK
jgi:hypothetical protein